MQKARRHSLKLLRPLVSARFQVLLHSAVRGSFHLSLTVLVHYRSLRSIRYWSTIGLSGVFSLGGWYRRFQTGFPWSRPTQDTATQQLVFKYTAFTFYGRTFQIVLLTSYSLGCSAFARHYLRNHCCFLFLQVLRCFSSLRSPHIVVMTLQVIGFPHSEISGSRVICTSPELIAACHVLLRL